MTRQEQWAKLEGSRSEWTRQITKLSESFSRARAKAMHQVATATNKELGAFSQSVGEGLPIDTESLQMLEMKHGTQQ